MLGNSTLFFYERFQMKANKFLRSPPTSSKSARIDSWTRWTGPPTPPNNARLVWLPIQIPIPIPALLLTIDYSIMIPPSSESRCSVELPDDHLLSDVHALKLALCPGAWCWVAWIKLPSVLDNAQGMDWEVAGHCHPQLLTRDSQQSIWSWSCHPTPDTGWLLCIVFQLAWA